MRTFLVATDFSKAGHNACLYGAELAKAFHARLILFSAYQQVPVPLSDAPVIQTPEDMKDFVQQRLEDESRAINPANEFQIETICRDGTAANMILGIARLKQAELIIAGMKAPRVKMQRLLGSTVTALARRTSIPLMVIPETAKYAGLPNLALATEKDIAPDTDTRAMDFLLEIGKTYHSRLFLVRIAKNRYHEMFESLNRPFYLSRATKLLDPQYECIESKDVPSALNEFIGERHIDMLVLLPQEHSLLDKWFVKSISRSVVFGVQVPVLILPHLYGIP
ncbi:MAG: universal stress protein [Bacteroidota bacterium]|nr:universal stress protein [Bacteroidota bacterium]MDP4215605.1 universal stress protein [Bacteroidota bacterium]MDP4259553.1 universal stress protein [Bacteroidota bacterium]